jgi:hypothetical protein
MLAQEIRLAAQPSAGQGDAEQPADAIREAGRCQAKQ